MSMPSSLSATPPAPTPAFDVVLYPHRSLGQMGFVLLMLAIVLVSAGLGIAFVLAGAWPVSGFLGLDVLLLYFAFRWCRREGRRAEIIRLDARGLTVRRIEPDGKTREWTFEPYWVRVAMDDPPRHASRLTVSAHGRTLALGGFLTPHERLEVARALERALAPLKRPLGGDTVAQAPPSR